MAIDKKRAICEMCHARCRVAVHVEDGRIVKLEEDRTYPLADEIFPPTRACLRLQGAKEWVDHPGRLNYPLKRAAGRGEGKWQKIPWDQAFDEIGEKLRRIKQEFGPEAIASTMGTARTTTFAHGRFHHLLGSPNYAGQSQICQAPMTVVCTAMFGWPQRQRMVLTIDKGSATRCIMLVGIDPSQSVLRLWKGMQAAANLGIKIIVIDPRKTQSAGLADCWLQLRPGTDTALLMSMVNVIIEEGLYDKEFVARWCHGFDELKERAREYPPETVAEVTWLTADKIREAARMYATNRPAISLHGMGTEHLSNAIEAIQARYILAAITGNIDIPGGHYMPGPARCVSEPELELEDLLSPEQKKKQLGADRFRLLAWPGHDLILQSVKKTWGKPYSLARTVAIAHAPTTMRAILNGTPYPVRALLTIANNPLVTYPNTRLVHKALKSLDLSVVFDYWLTPSAELADYVLPVASWMERPFFYSIYGTDCNMVGGEQALPATVPGKYDRKTDYEIFRGLGLKLGQGDFWPWENLEQVFDHQLGPLGLTFREFMERGGYDFPPPRFKKYEKIGFATPTGKVELSSTVFARLGYDPLPRYEESHENPLSRPELAKEYPLMLITGGRFLPYYHSEHRNIEYVRRRRPHPLVQINPKTAAGLGIEDGDRVWIETPRGRIRMKCRLFDGIDPRVVHCEHGWWFPELPGEEPWLHGVFESNVNVLTDDDPDVCNKLSGGWPLKTALCKVYKAKEY